MPWMTSACCSSNLVIFVVLQLAILVITLLPCCVMSISNLVFGNWSKFGDICDARMDSLSFAIIYVWNKHTRAWTVRRVGNNELLQLHSSYPGLLHQCRLLPLLSLANSFSFEHQVTRKQRVGREKNATTVSCRADWLTDNWLQLSCSFQATTSDEKRSRKKLSASGWGKLLLVTSDLHHL